MGRLSIVCQVGLLHLLSVMPIMAQKSLDAGQIAPELLINADAVVRSDDTVWEIESIREAKKIKHLVVTVLREGGKPKYDQLGVQYDKFVKVLDIEGKLYDSKGKLVRKAKNADIEDFSMSLLDGDITDARVKMISLSKADIAYPYTVEYTYEIRSRNMMSFPDWSPIIDPKTSIEHSSFAIKAPTGFKFRFKEYNGIAPGNRVADQKGVDTYTWNVGNRQSTADDDPYQLPDTERVPFVMSAPSEFEIQDYQGNFNTWEDFGKFYSTLNAGRDVLPPAVLSEIRTVAALAKTDREKAVLVYKWMQSRSRYVSIQLGIGGWQTTDATTVANTGYGDCKALTNFTMAALRSIGVRSYAALIRAGEGEDIKPDFPSNQFNHVIACALVDNDTLWLECTSQTTLPNFMGTFTGGRYALLVAPDGGKLVRTPANNAGQNLRESGVKVVLGPSGDGKVEVRTLYTGLRHETRASLVQTATKEEQKKWLLNHINLPSLDLERFELTQGQDPSVTEKLTLNVRNCATKTGTRLFIKPSLMSRTFDMPAATDRTTDFYLPVSEYNFTDLDTVSYEVPASYKLETILPAFQISSSFGSYELKTSYENNKLICARKVVMNGGRYASKDFAAWVDFLKKIRKADRAQVVFVENKL